MALVVRNSELSVHRECRQAWWWEYRERWQVAKAKPALSFGSLIHRALELRYPKGVKRGPSCVKCWDMAWAEYIEAGGEPFDVLKDVPAEDLGREMMRNYQAEYGKDDEFKVIATEQSFQVDIYDPRTEKLLGVFTGTMDAVIMNRRTRRIGLFEHKTGASLEPFGAPLLLDPQAGTYWTLGPIWLRHTGVLDEDEDLDFVLYNRLRKAFADTRPRNEDGHCLNKDGTVSKNQPPPLFKREYTWRTDEDRHAVMDRIVQQMREMKMVERGKLGIYKNPGKHCGFCQFRDMCEVHETDSDWQAVRKATMTTWDPYADHREGLTDE